MVSCEFEVTIGNMVSRVLVEGSIDEVRQVYEMWRDDNSMAVSEAMEDDESE